MSAKRDNSTSNRPEVAIVGAGMGGLLTGILLAKRGHSVRLFERRTREEILTPSPQRMTITLSERGLSVLEDAGLRESVQGRALLLRERVVHCRGRSYRYAYDSDKKRGLYAVGRHELAEALLVAASVQQGLAIEFGQAFESLDKNAQTASFRAHDGKTSTVAYGLLVGADGAFSRVRTQMQKGERADYTQRFSSWGYMDVPISAAGAMAADGGLHVWPGKDRLLIVIPMIQGLAGFLFCDLDSIDFAESHTLSTFIGRSWPTFPSDSIEGAGMHMHCGAFHPMVQTRTSKWTYGSSIALVGDACHAILPFLGQGTSAAFEDAWELARTLGDSPSTWARDLAAYQAAQKPNTDALEEFAEKHLASLTIAPERPLRAAVARVLDLVRGALSGRRRSAYESIAHTRVPIRQIVSSVGRH